MLSVVLVRSSDFFGRRVSAKLVLKTEFCYFYPIFRIFYPQLTLENIKKNIAFKGKRTHFSYKRKYIRIENKHNF